MNPIGLVGIAAGLFCVVAAYKDWERFFTHHKAKFIVKMLGREGARVFYTVVGCVFIAGGMFALLRG